ALAPTDDEIEAEFRRLYGALEAWQSAAEGIKAALTALPEGHPKKAVAFRVTHAQLVGDRLQDAAGALASWRAVIALEPGHRQAILGVVRAGAAVGAWDAIAEDALAFFRAHESIDDEVSAAIEAAAVGHRALDTLAPAGEGAAGFGVADMPALAAAIDARGALWHRDQRGDVEGAKAALERSLAAAPGHVGRLEMLVELQRATPNEALIGSLLALAGH